MGSTDCESARQMWLPIVKSRIRILLLLGLIGILVVGACLKWVSGREEGSKEITYKSKPLSKWFYGQRKDFFISTTRDAADDAFKALGTNAFPFLLSRLKNGGSSVLYFKLYQAVPSRVQAWLPYPLLSDDIQVITLAHLSKVEDIPPEWLAALARQVPNLKNPRARHRGLMTVQMLAGGRQDRSLISLCKDLLDDSHFGVRLNAAILLAELDPGETKSFPILIGALVDKEKLISSYAITGYWFRQPPGGSGSGPVTPFTGQTRSDVEEAERRMVLDALEELKSHLNEQQRGLVRQYQEARQGR